MRVRPIQENTEASYGHYCATHVTTLLCQTPLHRILMRDILQHQIWKSWLYPHHNSLLSQLSDPHKVQEELSPLHCHQIPVEHYVHRPYIHKSHRYLNVLQEELLQLTFSLPRMTVWASKTLPAQRTTALLSRNPNFAFMFTAHSSTCHFAHHVALREG